MLGNMRERKKSKDMYIEGGHIQGSKIIIKASYITYQCIDINDNACIYSIYNYR